MRIFQIEWFNEDEFLEDLKCWDQTDRKTASGAIKFVEAILRDPFVGFGKPKPIKYLDPRYLVKENNQGAVDGLSLSGKDNNQLNSSATRNLNAPVSPMPSTAVSSSHVALTIV